MIFVDRPTWPGHGHLWSHLISDRSFDELHAFAASIGLPRRAFERDHYDVVDGRFSRVVEAGALVISSREIVDRLQASGLRHRKRSRLAGPEAERRG